jgi:A/G-specific adenine glycosylase
LPPSVLGYHRAMAVEALLEWFRSNARKLPWRTNRRDPYRVVVSEFMLQQTQVDRVVPRFEDFVERFPDFGALAAAAEDDVVQAWSGLGYYRRARLLHRLGCEVAARGGELPTTASELQSLPGLGPYTAAAVASLAFGQAAPVLDGNVLRVAARVLALSGDPRAAACSRQIRGWILELMEGSPPAEVNEALMELGATVCTPVSPSCADCPLATACRACAEGRQHHYPPPRRRRATVDLRWAAAVCTDGHGRMLVRRITEGQILIGLWLPPIVEIACEDDAGKAARALLQDFVIGDGTVRRPVRHTITHRRIDVIPVHFSSPRVDTPPRDWRWVDPADPRLPTSSLLVKLAVAVGSAPP